MATTFLQVSERDKMLEALFAALTPSSSGQVVLGAEEMGDLVPKVGASKGAHAGHGPWSTACCKICYKNAFVYVNDYALPCTVPSARVHSAQRRDAVEG